MLAALLSMSLGGAALWLLWPAASLALVSLNYAGLGAEGFQKRPDGRLSPAAMWLFAPYLLGAWINTFLWRGDGRSHVHLSDGVWVGRLSAGSSAFAGVVDLCAELPGCRSAHRATLPMLDLVTPSPDQLLDAARAIEQARGHGSVLVCCALGYSRSAAAAAAWLVLTGRAATAEAAVEQLRQVRPHLVLSDAALSNIAAVGALR